jgi:uncharacterized protein (DUF1330 family)
MPTYVIAEITIHDPQTYDRYKELAPPSIFQYGGRYATRGGSVEALEGNFERERLVILEFPSAGAARRWWNSPEYAEAKRIRQSCATARIVLTEGPSLEPDAASSPQ